MTLLQHQLRSAHMGRRWRAVAIVVLSHPATWAFLLGLLLGAVLL
jgi:hypothetical protein